VVEEVVVTRSANRVGGRAPGLGKGLWPRLCAVMVGIGVDYYILLGVCS
jgi:hypothetical protein